MSKKSEFQDIVETKEQNRQFKNKKHHYKEEEYDFDDEDMDKDLIDFCKKHLKMS